MTDKPDNVTVEELDIELPDAVLDAEDEQQTLPKHPVPAGIKYGLPVFVLVIALSGFFVYQAISDSSKEEDLVFEPEEITDLARQEPPVLRLSPSLPDQDLPDRAAVDSLKAKVQTLEEALRHASSQVSEQRDTVNHQNSRIQQVMESLEHNRALMTELASAIKGLSTRLEGVEGSVGNNSQRIHQLTVKRKRQPRAHPAFNLLSIDQWGGRDSVVLELQNDTTMAAVGDIRAGWTIESIDRPNCIDVVRVSDKVKARVCRKSNS